MCHYEISLLWNAYIFTLEPGANNQLFFLLTSHPPPPPPPKKKKKKKLFSASALCIKAYINLHLQPPCELKVCKNRQQYKLWMIMTSITKVCVWKWHFCTLNVMGRDDTGYVKWLRQIHYHFFNSPINRGAMAPLCPLRYASERGATTWIKYAIRDKKTETIFYRLLE